MLYVRCVLFSFSYPQSTSGVRIIRALSLQLGITALLSLVGFGALAETWVQGLDELPITLSYEGQPEPPVSFNVPADRRTGRTVFPLLDQVIAHRDDHKAVVEFKLPPSAPIGVAQIYVRAYNDDPKFSCDVHFELDGEGSNLDTFADPRTGFFKGQGLPPKEEGEGRYNLSALPNKAEGGTFSLFDLLRSPGYHKIVAWVCANEQHGSASWITLDLVLSGDDHDGAGGPRASGCGSCLSHPVR